MKTKKRTAGGGIALSLRRSIRRRTTAIVPPAPPLTATTTKSRKAAPRTTKKAIDTPSDAVDDDSIAKRCISRRRAAIFRRSPPAPQPNHTIASTTTPRRKKAATNAKNKTAGSKSTAAVDDTVAQRSLSWARIDSPVPSPMSFADNPPVQAQASDSSASTLSKVKFVTPRYISDAMRRYRAKRRPSDGSVFVGDSNVLRISIDAFFEKYGFNKTKVIEMQRQMRFQYIATIVADLMSYMDYINQTQIGRFKMNIGITPLNQLRRVQHEPGMETLPLLIKCFSLGSTDYSAYDVLRDFDRPPGHGLRLKEEKNADLTRFEKNEKLMFLVFGLYLDFEFPDSPVNFAEEFVREISEDGPYLAPITDKGQIVYKMGPRNKIQFRFQVHDTNYMATEWTPSGLMAISMFLLYYATRPGFQHLDFVRTLFRLEDFI